jgi:cytochrome c oxidase subunit I+III
MHFYDVAQGGQPLLWQHLFWIFAHPWVYALVLPAQGMVSEGLPVFCRRPLVGYTAVAIATVATMMMGFGVWVHHMFATGLPRLSLSLFSGVSIIIAIPSAVQIFAWIPTIWTGRPRITTAFLFYAAFIVMFVIGGVSGFVTASVPADWQLADTYWVVAHIHYVLIGINLFSVVGSLYYWFPKITGRMLNERLGQWNFWTMFIGFNVAFLPMHLTGLWGMPRRIYTYLPGMGWGALNLTTTIGAFILALGVLLLLINVVMSRASGEIAGPNPWDAGTLEWSTSSPPPIYDFAVIPQVFFHQPLWVQRLDVDSEPSVIKEGPVLAQGKEVLATIPIEAVPDLIVKMPEDSYAPFLLTLAMSAGFVGLLVNWWWLAGAGVFGVFLATLYWLWPEAELGQRVEA